MKIQDDIHITTDDFSANISGTLEANKSYTPPCYFADGSGSFIHDSRRIEIRTLLTDDKAWERFIELRGKLDKVRAEMRERLDNLPAQFSPDLKESR